MKRRRVTATEKARRAIHEDPAATNATIARRVGCSPALVRLVRAKYAPHTARGRGRATDGPSIAVEVTMPAIEGKRARVKGEKVAARCRRALVRLSRIEFPDGGPHEEE